MGGQGPGLAGGWQAPDITHHCGLFWAGEGCVTQGRKVRICFSSAPGGGVSLLDGRAGPPQAWALEVRALYLRVPC